MGTFGKQRNNFFCFLGIWIKVKSYALQSMLLRKHVEGTRK